MESRRDRVQVGSRGGRAGVCRRQVLRSLATAAAGAACLPATATASPEAAARAADRVVLQLRWHHQFQFAGYYAAHWQGYYAAAGLEVEIRPGVRPGGAVVSAVEEVGAGRAQFGVGAADILTGYDRGLPLTVLASVFQKNEVAFYARADTPLETPADLLRLRVGRRPRDGFIEAALAALLRAEGLDPGSLVRHDLVGDGVSQFLSGELAGKADVLPGMRFAVPFGAREAGVDLRELRPEAFGVNFYGDSLFADARVVRERPDLARRFVEASLQGWAYAFAHVEEVARRIVAELPRETPPARDPLAYNLFQAAEVAKLALADTIPLGHVNPERWRRMHEHLARAGMVAGPLDLEAFVYQPDALAARRQAWRNRLSVGAGAAFGALSLVLVAWAWRLRAGGRRATAAVRRSEEIYRALVETAPDAIMVNRDGVIGFANPRLARLLGARDVTEVIGRPVDEFVDEEARPHVDVQATAAAEEEQEQEEAAGPGATARPARLLKVRRLDGTLVETEPSAARVELDGRPAVQVALRDLTERRRAEREIEERNQALEAANQELEQFASVAAHDLRSPLRHISLLAGWLEEELGDQLPRQAKVYVDQLRERAASVDSLIAGLRQYALAGSREHPGTPIDLPSLVQGIVKLQDPPPGFRFEVDVSPPVITAAEPPLAMVLRNLVANAIKHHDRPAGVVRIRARPCEGGGAVEFAVEDDGPGIEPRLRERVFDMFQSFGPGLKPVGDGVGLALVRRTVTAHRGKLWLELPGATAPDEGAAEGAPLAPDAAGGGRGTIIRFTWPTLGGLPT